jgi:hypothetical protein
MEACILRLVLADATMEQEVSRITKSIATAGLSLYLYIATTKFGLAYFAAKTYICCQSRISCLIKDAAHNRA